MLKIEKICLQITKDACFSSLTSPHLLFCHSNGSYKYSFLLYQSKRQLFAPSENARSYASKLTEDGFFFIHVFLFLKLVWEFCETEHKLTRSADMKFNGGAIQMKQEKPEVLSHKLELHIDVVAFQLFKTQISKAKSKQKIIKMEKSKEKTKPLKPILCTEIHQLKPSTMSKIISKHCCDMYRITEGGLEWTSEYHLVQTLCSSRATLSQLTGPCLNGFRVCLRMKTS